MHEIMLDLRARFRNRQPRWSEVEFRILFAAIGHQHSRDSSSECVEIWNLLCQPSPIRRLCPHEDFDTWQRRRWRETEKTAWVVERPGTCSHAHMEEPCRERGSKGRLASSRLEVSQCALACTPEASASKCISSCRAAGDSSADMFVRDGRYRGGPLSSSS